MARKAIVSPKLEAAKQRRNTLIEERNMLLAWVARLVDDPSIIHIAPTQQPDSGLLPYVLCIHDKDVALTWKISAEEFHAYFEHWDLYPCKKKIATQEVRKARVAAFASSEQL